MAAIIGRGGTDNNSPDEPPMAIIIGREVALLTSGGLYYQTLAALLCVPTSDNIPAACGLGKMGKQYIPSSLS